jgi:sigma-B regulation protein RsbU (phosphoserine phosphatase)
MTGLPALLQINATDLRHLLVADAFHLALGIVLVTAGLLALVLWVVARRHAAPLVWLGVFAFLYGLRLLLRTATFRVGFELAPAGSDYLAAALTYAIPLPLVLFARATFPARKRVLGWIALGVAVFAVGATASDAILHRPDSARVPNNLIAVGFFLALVARLFRPGLAPARELWTLRIGTLAVSLGAVADNLRGMGVVSYPGPDLEPLGAAVAITCLGMLATWRVLGDARRLVAIDRELDVARRIQSSILPSEMPRVPGLAVAARYRPMTAVAGDFYDFLETDGDGLGVLVADVSGHGVPAALIASMVKVALAAQQARAHRPAAVLKGLNEVLCGRLGGQYVTAAYVFVEASSGLMRYAAAGHPPMLRAPSCRPEVREIERNGLVLGFVPTADYDELEQPLEAGDRLLLYTDGLVEAANASDELFGLDRVKTAVASSLSLPPSEAADALLQDVDTWSGRPAGDDVTLVLLDWSRSPRLAAETRPR